ncbi:MAG TPA: hypothetical protein VI819_00095 [Patescibacteria group bacterium]|nr:hypothetical protein [Patescibacteria group bacterium]
MPEIECKHQYGKLGLCDPKEGLTGCSLSREFIGQSQTGGARTSSFERFGNGPFWPRESWNNYVKRLRVEAGKGCACASKLYNRIQEITSQKESNGELIDPDPKS